MKIKTILMIEDHALFRDGLSGVLNQHFDAIELVEVSSIEQALTLQIAPYLVLLDIQLHGMNGLDGIAPILARWPDVKIMMMSDSSQALNVEKALLQGAHGFIDKSQSSQVMLASLHHVTDGALLPKIEIAVDGLAEMAVDGLTEIPSDQPAEVADSTGLSEKQLQILTMINLGLSNKLIGQKLHISEHTVRWYVQKILFALKASSRSEAAFKARQMGLIG